MCEYSFDFLSWHWVGKHGGGSKDVEARNLGMGALSQECEILIFLQVPALFKYI